MYTPPRCYAFLGLLLVTAWASRGSSAQAPDDVETIKSQSLFFENFDNDEWQSRWRHSSDAKYNGRFTADAAKGWTNKGLKVPEKNKYYGLTALLDAAVDPVVASGPTQLPLVVQYEVKYDAGVTCGGSYLKLLTADPALTPEGLMDSTPYSIMFGPDRCGGPGKVHLILRHRNPVNGSIEEKHLASPPAPETDDYTHVYTLKIFPDHTFEVLVDGVVKSSGSLTGDSTLQPPLLPPREVPDPRDTKPYDWVDVSEIPDPDAVKPDTWDERETVEDDKAVKPRGWLEGEDPLINDPAAKRPEDWDDEEDGAWEPNQLPNPKCKVGCGPWKRPTKRNPAWKGAWKAPLINNPHYKGPWVQKRIPNPDFFEEEEPIRSGVAPIGGVALELWTVDSGYMFDNVLIARDPAVAELALQQLWKPRHEAEVKASEAAAAQKAKEEKDKRKEEEQKEAAAKGKKKKSRRGGAGSRYSSEQLEQLTQSILELFEDGAKLAPLAPYLAPLLDFLRSDPNAIVVLLGLAPLLLLTAVVLLRGTGGRKKKAPAEYAVDGDPAGECADDEGPVLEAEPGATEPTEDEGAGDAEPTATAAAVPEAADGAKEATAASEEIEEDEEEEESAAAGPRRRTRRAA